MEPPYALFVLASAGKGLKAEAALRAAGVEAALMAVPRSVGSQCGVCLRVAVRQRKTAEELLAETGVAISAVHEIDDRLQKTDGESAVEKNAAGKKETG
jgi:histidinol-phosphate/aromatic aminotransferase/cobyric acid decarboxylase-like protein